MNNILNDVESSLAFSGEALSFLMNENLGFTDSQIMGIMKKTKIFSRMRPSDKKLIITQLKKAYENKLIGIIINNFKKILSYSIKM